jgi:serine/threonine protein kinase
VCDPSVANRRYALSRAHQGKILHEDVKSANILVTAEGQIKLGDLGIAHISTRISGSGNLMGTPAHIVYVGGKTYDVTSKWDGPYVPD